MPFWIIPLIVWAYFFVLQWLVMVGNDAPYWRAFWASAFWFVTLPIVFIENTLYHWKYVKS
jgi:hypothetical protein